MQSMARRLTKSNHSKNDASGAFMGFDDTSLEDSENSDVEKGDCMKSLDEVLKLIFCKSKAFVLKIFCYQEPLITNGLGLQVKRASTEFALDGLSNWLDRLFEGTTQRYSINYWPDFGNF